MMSNRFGKQNWSTALVAAIFFLALTENANAQFGTVNQIGGVYIDASGVLSEAPERMQRDTQQKVRKSLAAVGSAARQATDLRVISVRALENALEAAASGTPLTDEVKFMGGIQRIEFVLVQPDTGDILLAGPGEGWIADQAGNVVGETTGRPVIRLEDFIVALRTAEAANRDAGISVSIDPTAEGVKRLRALYSRVDSFRPELKSRIEETMGAQTISLTGMPTDSRMAQILVAADYRMKRMAMGFQPAAVEGLPSVLEMAQESGKSFRQDPRFWLECSYDSIKRSEDGLTWQITGPGARALTETAGAKGKIKTHPIARQWAANMTSKFAELANADPVFAELQNVMDMAVVAAMIRKHHLLDTASLSIPTLLGENEKIALPSWSVPKTVSTQCSFVRVRNNWMVTASGGVQVDSWGVLENVEIDNAIAAVAGRVSSVDAKNKTWWNAVN